MRDVGRLVVGALVHLPETKDASLKVNSFTTTPQEILAEFERQTGGSGWTVEYTSLDALKQLEQGAWAKNSPHAAAVTLRRIWTEGGTLYAHRDNDVVGLEQAVDDLSTAVAQAIEAQRKV
nr:hypothetical protein CFP56_28505 [Quercus suber]